MKNLYAYRNYITDSKSFMFDENGQRFGDTPNILIDAKTEEMAKFLVNCVEKLEKSVFLIEESIAWCPSDYAIYYEMQKFILENKGSS